MSLRLIVIGAGDRGTGYAALAKAHSHPIDIVGVAEPRAERRELFCREFGVPTETACSDWREFGDIEADAVIIATPDREHTAPAIAMAERGLHILLEKPMAPDLAGCEAIATAIEAAKVKMAVGHVLRYTPYTRALKQLLEEGAIGELVSVQHLEPVGHWHMAHSFVRGNWRNEAESAPILLAKSCHDIDWLCYLIGRPCESVASFGGLHHFTEASRPEGAADRCVECPSAVEAVCPYSAPRIYGRFLKEGASGWPLSVLAPEPNAASIDRALREGPYGRCVYACDNDVVDHQVVAMQFAGGVTANFTMTAFGTGGRRTRMFGTHGELVGDSKTIQVTEFLTGETREVVPEKPETGHGGGDGGLFDAFVQTLVTPENAIVSGVAETLASHRLVFLAEQARRSGTVVRCQD